MEYELSNGLTIEVEWDSIEGPDRDSGIFSPYVTDFWITAVGGRKCSRRVSNWLCKRMSSGDEEDICEKIVEENW
jgi:hypothetical protein